MLLYATNHSLAIAQEILQCGVHAAGDDMDNTVIVYTNADIAVQPHFYAYADKLAKVSTGENISYRYHDCCVIVHHLLSIFTQCRTLIVIIILDSLDFFWYFCPISTTQLSPSWLYVMLTPVVICAVIILTLLATCCSSMISFFSHSLLSVTRRELLAGDYPQLALSGRMNEALDIAYNQTGMDHKGHDCFIMPARVRHMHDACPSEPSTCTLLFLYIFLLLTFLLVHNNL